MKQQPHNPHCKLISCTINGWEFVYSEENSTGLNKGLEVYRYKFGADHFYNSSRYREGKIPNKYTEVYEVLKSLADDCREGHKLTLLPSQYVTIQRSLINS